MFVNLTMISAMLKGIYTRRTFTKSFILSNGNCGLFALCISHSSSSNSLILPIKETIIAFNCCLAFSCLVPDQLSALFLSHSSSILMVVVLFTVNRTSYLRHELSLNSQSTLTTWEKGPYERLHFGVLSYDNLYTGAATR